jgi:hypothetical protein
VPEGTSVLLDPFRGPRGVIHPRLAECPSGTRYCGTSRSVTRIIRRGALHPSGRRRGGRRPSRGFPRPRHARQAVDNRATGGRRAYVTGSDDARARMRVRARYGLQPRRSASSLARLARATSDLAHDAPPIGGDWDSSDEERADGGSRDSGASPGGNAEPRHRRRCVPTLGPRYRGDAPHAALPGQARNCRVLEDAEASTPGDQRHGLALRTNQAPVSSMSTRPPLAGCLPPIVARTSGAVISRSTAATYLVASETADATSPKRSATQLRSSSWRTIVSMQRTADWARGLTCRRRSEHILAPALGGP